MLPVNDKYFSFFVFNVQFRPPYVRYRTIYEQDSKYLEVTYEYFLKLQG